MQGTGQLEMLFGLFLSAAVTMVATPLLIWLAKCFSVYDAAGSAASSELPGKMGILSAHRQAIEAGRKIHKGLIPRLGGIALFLGFIAASFLTPPKGDWQIVVFFSFAMFALGLWDDFHPVPAFSRLLAQLLITSLAVYFGHLAISELRLFPGWEVSLNPFTGGVLAVFIVVGAVNALNFIDGLDGLAGGISLIGILLLSLVYFLTHHNSSAVLIMTLPLTGAIIGFLRYNTHPATIFMGDGGSNWLGFMVGYLLLICADPVKQEAPNVSSFLPLTSLLLCIAVPIFDTLAVIISRHQEGKSPFHADNRHIHHRLLKLGLSHGQVVTSIYALALILGLLGISPILFPRVINHWVPNITFLVLTALALFSNRFTINLATPMEFLKKVLVRNKQMAESRILKNLETSIRYGLYVILLGCPLLVSRPSELLGTISLGTAGFILLTVLIPNKRQDNFFDSLVITGASLVILGVNNQTPLHILWEGRVVNVQYIYNSLFVILGFTTSLLLLISIRREDIEVTPSDFLLIAAPILLLLAPQGVRSQFLFESVALKALVVFLSVRVIGVRNPNSRVSLRIVTLVSLLMIYLIAAHGLHPVPA